MHRFMQWVRTCRATRARGPIPGIAIVFLAATAGFIALAQAAAPQPSAQSAAISKCTLFGMNNGTVICPPVGRKAGPILQFVSVTERDNPDGTHAVKALTEVVATSAQNQLGLLVLASGLMDVRVSPGGGPNGNITLSQPARAPGAWQAVIAKPRGRYAIVVTTKTKTPVRFGFNFQ